MEAIRYLYILSLIMHFVLSLGNRPQGSKVVYRFSVVPFAVIMVVMTYVVIYGVVYTAVYLKYDGHVLGLPKQGKNCDIRVSEASTYGLYIASAILYLDPWHTLTSLIQSML